MELSDMDTVPKERSNQMALRDRCPQRVSQTVPEERRNQKVSQMALTYRHQQRGLQLVRTDGQETEVVFIFGTRG